jgi:hypothetical protein
MKTPGIEKFFDEVALKSFGRSRTLAISGHCCVKCGKDATKFKDEVSKREFKISGLCQHCQDDVWGSIGED